MIPIVAPVPLIILPPAGGMVDAFGSGLEFLAVMRPLADIADVTLADKPVIEVKALPDVVDVNSPMATEVPSAMPVSVQPMVVGLPVERMFLKEGTEDPVGQSAIEPQTPKSDSLDMLADFASDSQTETNVDPDTVVAVLPIIAAAVFFPDLLPQTNVGIDLQRPKVQPSYDVGRNTNDLANTLPMGMVDPATSQQELVAVTPDSDNLMQAAVTKAVGKVPHRALPDTTPVQPPDTPNGVALDATAFLDGAPKPPLAPQRPVAWRAEPDVAAVSPTQIFAQPLPVQPVPQGLLAPIPKGHSAPPLRSDLGIVVVAPPPADSTPILRQHVVSAPRPTTAERAFATRVSQTLPFQTTPTETVAAPPDTNVVVVANADAQIVAMSPKVAQIVAVDGAAAIEPAMPIPTLLSPPDIPLLPVTQSGDKLSVVSPIPLQTLPAVIAQIASTPGVATVEIRLDPVELGAVQVTMQGTEKDMSIVVMVERPDTLELLRKHADQFLSDLRQSGFSGTNLTFNLSDQNGAAQRQPTPLQTLPHNLPPQPSLPDSRPVPKSTGGLDMRL